MSATFPQRLRAAVEKTGAPCVVGLDPRPQRLPRELFSPGGDPIPAIRDFHRFVLDEAAGLVPCVKPQAAFFEALGPEGFALFHQTCRDARERGFLVIGDVKRGDIGSTAEAYAKAHFPSCDALTLNPYLGSDSLEPFFSWCREEGKGVFILVRTSNKGNEFQPLPVGEGTLAEAVARAVRDWGDSAGMPADPESGYNPVGAVVGATHPGEIPRFRELLPRSWILLPGYGAQGGKASDLTPAFDGRGLGALVNSSRGITACFDPEDKDWRRAVGLAIRRFREDIQRAREGSG